MVLQCSKLFYYKVFGDFLRQDSQNSYSFDKIQNVGETELSEIIKKKLVDVLYNSMSVLDILNRP